MTAPQMPSEGEGTAYHIVEGETGASLDVEKFSPLVRRDARPDRGDDGRRRRAS